MLFRQIKLCPFLLLYLLIYRLSCAQSVNDRHDLLSLRKNKGKDLLKYMDLTADPCTDFYSFACGNWIDYQKKHMLPNEERSAQNVVERQINKFLQDLLQEPAKEESISVRKVKDFYASCINVVNPSTVQRNFLLTFIKQHGGLRILPNTGWQINYDWVQVIAQLRSNYGMDILIGLEIDTNLQTMRGNSIYIGEPKATLIPSKYCSAIATQDANLHDQVYENIQRSVAADMQSWLQMQESDANRFAGDIVRFEFELCKRMRQEHSMRSDELQPNIIESNESGTRARYRVGQSRLHGLREQNPLYPRMGLYQLTQSLGNVIDFKMFVDLSFDTTINNQVYIRSRSYLEQLVRVIKINGKNTIAGYIMYRALAELNFPRNDHPLKRPKYCVELAQRYFPKILGDMYLKRVNRVDSRNDLEQIFNEIIKSFEQRLQVDWMDENDRRAARQKLTQYKLGFSHYENAELNELLIERLDYWHKLEAIMKYIAKQKLDRLHNGDYGQRGEAVESYEVDMKLMPMIQEISIGWGLLQMPFYNLYYPTAMKYAMLGQRIAHELIYAFDEQGWNMNPLSPMRWRPDTLQEYRNRSECYRAQYSNYLYNNPDIFRNASKLRELIADSSGLHVAFNAYLNWLENIDIKNSLLYKETLPDLNFSNTQLFFIYFAQTRCLAKYNETAPPNFLPLDWHKPERYNVNGILSNYDEFGKEFGCALGTQMNIDDRCLIY